MRTPLLEAEQDGSIRIQDLTKGIVIPGSPWDGVLLVSNRNEPRSGSYHVPWT